MPAWKVARKHCQSGVDRHKEHDHIIERRDGWDQANWIALIAVLLTFAWSLTVPASMQAFVAWLLVMVIYIVTCVFFAKWTWRHIKWHNASGKDAGEGKESDGTHE